MERAQSFVERCKTGRGPTLDVDAFWAANARAVRDPFASDCPHLPLGISMSDECVFDELGLPTDWHRLFHDDDFHSSLCSRYNDLAQIAVGRRLVPEHLTVAPKCPKPKELSDIFEGRSEWREDCWSYWLYQSANTEDELKALLDRVERRLEDLRAFLLPEDWAVRKAAWLASGKSLPLYRHQRGPVTFATSIYGAENLIFLIVDNPDLAARFSDLIRRAILERARIIDEEAGFDQSSAPRGWSFADDNCALLNPEMYRLFGFPVLKAVFERYAPGPGDWRFQHSDSEMSHLLPILGELGLTEVNFGPSITVEAIREHCPRAIIRGQLSPMTFCRNDEVGIVAETLRDFEASREARGVLYSTAGSVNYGSKLSGLRLIMAAIQELCRY
jgi:Uroporphyrinogen decarboxylase (URO-D).